jgi:hypothetical protein
LAPSELLSEVSISPVCSTITEDLQDSPFYEEAAQRSRYLSLTEVHSSALFKPLRYSSPQLVAAVTKKDLETLREAVRTENYRMRALDAQRKFVLLYA